MQSVYEESLPRPSVDAVRAEVLPSAWILQPSRKHGQDCVTVIYMLQVRKSSHEQTLYSISTKALRERRM